MSIHVALNHVMHYRYADEVRLGPQIIRLRPAPPCRTRILSYSLPIAPAGHFINWQQDPQANYLARVVFQAPTRELRIETDLVCEMSVLNPFDFFLEPYARSFPFEYQPDELAELQPYLESAAAAPPRVAEYLAGIARAPRGTVDFLVELNQRLARDIKYVIRMEPGVQSEEETLEKRSGSCRDSAALLVHLLRRLGLAARFVSGYLIQLTADVRPLEGPEGPSRDFTDLHAWCEVYLPGAGWIGLDATSGLLTGEGHIPLACAPEPQSAAALTGKVDPSETVFDHRMQVSRIREAPRVTKPYSDEQWAAIGALGRRIDARLAADDVRLTMGGEPTFVSSEEFVAPEWRIAALGEHKRRVAAQLFERLKRRYAPAGLAHFGQGKWYPGEPLPRWSLNCFWRRDGEPIWADPALRADDSREYRDAPGNAPRLLQAVAERLGIAREGVIPAYEDALHHRWRESLLPVNAKPAQARPAHILDDGLRDPAGHVLPIARPHEGAAWQSRPWTLRRERCYLYPGDSPLGYRLPLDSLPVVGATDQPDIHPPDPGQAFAPLAPYAHYRAPPPPVRRSPSPSPESAEEPAPVRTAMCVEVRHGVLYVFLPPVRSLEDYLELVAAVEASAQRLGQPVVLEGYEPPPDPRLMNFRVTPDPGVIEVNVQPCATWEELDALTTQLYEDAAACKLRAEKFMLDGRHTGTGGGNHLVLGGARAMDSPFLRRPDLLRSLISYWHNHPSLSYLFSGLFIGPTSQAPRVDEARNDALYELELAFAQFPAPGAKPPPWLVDRLLRNLLIDVTGNTHRAEFCIDKLFSPDSSSCGR